MPPDTRIGRFSAPFLLLMVLSLGACATEPDTAKAGPEVARDAEPAKTASHPLEIGKLDDWLRSACLREASGLRPTKTISPELMCEAMFEGLVDSAAEMGRRLEGSDYCVAQGFDAGAYKARVVRALEVGVMRDRAFTEFALGLLKSGDKDKNCSWTGERTLGDLANECHWFRAFEASDRNAALRDLARRGGIDSEEELRRQVAEGLSDCTGYFTGYMAASFFDEDAPAYCADSVRDKDPLGGDDFMMKKLAAISRGLEGALDGQTGRAEEPASPRLYPLMVDAFPCAG